ncbi:MAG: AF1514 family protein [Burkholderiales bacterium]
MKNYLQALQLAKADARLPGPMLLSWYDRDRDFEAPQHVSECHAAVAAPGCVDYGIHLGATLMVDVEDGRFVFFYRPVDI